jgi:hypothetical protein
VGSALSGVVICLDFGPFFFFSSLVPLPHVFPLFIYLVNDKGSTCKSIQQLHIELDIWKLKKSIYAFIQ